MMIHSFYTDSCFVIQILSLRDDCVMCLPNSSLSFDLYKIMLEQFIYNICMLVHGEKCSLLTLSCIARFY